MAAPLSLDTSSDAERLQLEALRGMTPAAKAALISGLTRGAHRVAAAGIRHRHPDASPREQFLRLAVVILGSTLARRAYPDIDLLD